MKYQISGYLVKYLILIFWISGEISDNGEISDIEISGKISGEISGEIFNFHS